MRRRDLPMNRAAVPSAAQPVKPNPEEATAEATVSQTARCMKCLAPTAAKRLEFPSSPAATDQCTAATAIHPSREEIAGKIDFMNPWNRNPIPGIFLFHRLWHSNCLFGITISFALGVGGKLPIFGCRQQTLFHLIWGQLGMGLQY